MPFAGANAAAIGVAAACCDVTVALALVAAGRCWLVFLNAESAMAYEDAGWEFQADLKTELHGL
jgi:hypothetical protein